MDTCLRHCLCGASARKERIIERGLQEKQKYGNQCHSPYRNDRSYDNSFA